MVEFKQTHAMEGNNPMMLKPSPKTSIALKDRLNSCLYPSAARAASSLSTLCLSCRPVFIAVVCDTEKVGLSDNLDLRLITYRAAPSILISRLYESHVEVLTCSQKLHVA